MLAQFFVVVCFFFSFFFCCYPKCFWLYAVLPVSDPSIEACTVLSALQSKIYHSCATPELFFACFSPFSSLTNTFPASPFHHCQSGKMSGVCICSNAYRKTERHFFWTRLYTLLSQSKIWKYLSN